MRKLVKERKGVSIGENRSFWKVWSFGAIRVLESFGGKEENARKVQPIVPVEQPSIQSR